jgi:hypothetical protein
MRFESWDEAGEALLENVPGVGKATVESLEKEMAVSTFEFGCAEAGIFNCHVRSNTGGW